MARRSSCSRLLIRVAGDMGFHVLSLVAQALWLRLAASAEAAGDGGRLGFPIAVSLAVSRLLSIEEADAVTALASLAAAGYLELDADGLTVWMPGARDAQAGIAAARRNGRAGGRPRKGETPEQYRERRARELTQQEMLLPLPGGREAVAETQETQPEPAGESSRAGGASPKPSPASASQAMGWVEMRALCDELETTAGIEGPPHPANFHTLRQMLNEGATPDILRQVIGQRAARDGYVTPRAGLGYFVKAVRDALRAPSDSRSGSLAITQAAKQEGLSAFGLRLQAWHEGGCVDPMPRPEAA